jgi:hypothetical protein
MSVHMPGCSRDEFHAEEGISLAQHHQGNMFQPPDIQEKPLERHLRRSRPLKFLDE